MNYNIDTEEGMTNSVKWLEEMLASGSKPAVEWFIPRSFATYLIYKPIKVYTSKGVDEPTERVLAAAGFTREEGNHALN